MIGNRTTVFFFVTPCNFKCICERFFLAPYSAPTSCESAMKSWCLATLGSSYRHIEEGKSTCFKDTIDRASLIEGWGPSMPFLEWKCFYE